MRAVYFHNKKTNRKRAALLVPVLAGLLLVGSAASAAEEDTSRAKTNASGTINCICSLEPKDFSALLNQQACQPPHNQKKESSDNPTYKQRVEQLRRELLRTSKAT
jgi:hypothetical protein